MLTKKDLITFIFVLSVFAVSGSVYASSSSIRIEEPESPATQAFQISYTALNIENKDVSVACYGKKPGSSSYEVIGSGKNLGPGGGSNECNISESFLDKDGAYSFKAIATISGEGNLESDEVAVVYDATGPNRPKYIEKDKQGSCRYEITFRTAKNGDTDYVEIYRGFDREFDVDGDTRIKTISIGPDEKESFDDELYSECGDKPYYAIRAFDEFGNPSNVTAEEIVETELIEITPESDSDGQTSEAIIVNTSGDGGSTSGLSSSSSSFSGDILGDSDSVDVVLNTDNEAESGIDEVNKLLDEKTDADDQEQEDEESSKARDALKDRFDNAALDLEQSEVNNRPFWTNPWLWIILLLVLFGIAVFRKG